MKNKILLEKLYQIVTKCQTSPVYSNLLFNNNYDMKENYIGSYYKMVLNNIQVINELNKGDTNGSLAPDMIYLNILVNKIKKPYKKFDKYRKNRFEYSVIVTPDYSMGMDTKFNNAGSHINDNEQIKFDGDELCKKFYEAVDNLFKFKKDDATKGLLKGLDRIIEHNVSAKREIELEKLMDDE